MNYEAINWLLCGLFVVIGVLNIIIVDVAPGLLYLLLALVYVPPLSDEVKRRLGLRVPFVLKIAVAFVVLWGTLAVGDLAELVL